MWFEDALANGYKCKFVMLKFIGTKDYGSTIKLGDGGLHATTKKRNQNEILKLR